MTNQLKIELPPDLVRSTVATIILDKLTPEQRDGLLAASLAHLVEPVPVASNGYGTPRVLPSPLQEAYSQAAAQMLSTLARERLESDPTFKARVNEMLEEALARFFSYSADPGKKSPREQLLERMVHGMANAFEQRY